MKSSHALSLLSLLPLVACGTAGTGPTTGGGTPPTPTQPALEAGTLGLSGLLSAVAASSTVRLDWVLPADIGAEGASSDVALFQAADPVQLFSGAPSHTGLGAGPLVVGGLANGVERFFQLGVREASGAYEPFGSVVSARPGQPVYVDPNADPSTADGTSPATAFPSLTSGLLTAAVGSGVVWARGGDYGQVSLPLLGGVQLFGGFAAGFDVSERDPAQNPTLLRGAQGIAVIGVQGTATAVVDGVEIDGGGLATHGVDSGETPLELRGVHVRGCTGRGISVRAPLAGDPIRVSIVDSSANLNGAEGFSGDGAMDLFVGGSSFQFNAQEGFDLDDLIAPDGDIVSFRVVDSVFAGNVTEGLDVDLAAPLTGGGAGGFFRVRVDGSRFDGNGNDGLLIDIEYESTPIWDADIEVKGCIARANGRAGIYLDVDLETSAWVHGVVASANGSDGVHVDSETSPGLVVVSNTVASGNLGAGIRASFGNQTLALSHCVVAGNLGGGVRSDIVEAGAASCVAYLQPAAFVGVRLVGCAEVTSPLTGAFTAAPEAYTQVVSVNGNVVGVASTSAIAPSAVVELSDDGVERVVASVNGGTITLDPAPDNSSVPSALGVFAPAGSVLEDYTLPPGSELIGVGMARVGAPAVDAGVWGGPVAFAPGTLVPLASSRFRVAGTTPALALGLANDEDLLIHFEDGAPDGTSLTTGVLRALDSVGAELPIDFQVIGNDVRVSPPPAGWGGAVTLEVHADLRAVGGEGLVAPVVLPLVN